MSYSPPSPLHLLRSAIGAIILLILQSTTIAAAFRVDGQNSPPRSTDISNIIATPQFDLPVLKEESSSSMMTINLVGEVSSMFGHNIDVHRYILYFKTYLYCFLLPQF